MEELKKIEELIGHLRSGLDLLQGVMKYNKEKSSKLNARESELDSKSNDLAQRESKIGPAEDVINMRGQVVADRAEAEKLLKDARIEVQKITEKIQADLAALGAAKQKAAADSKKAKDELVMIQKEWKGLEKEKKEWKDKFYENLKKKAK